MSLVDLTQPYRDGMFVLPSFPRVTIGRHQTLDAHGVSVTRIDAVVHAGTHLDAPSHFIADGASIERVPLERCSGPAVALRVDRWPGEEIRVADLEASGPVPAPGELVFLATGWARHFAGDPARYELHPHLSLAAAEWLIARGAGLVGIDAPTVDLPAPLRTADFAWPVHHLLLGRGVFVIEHVGDLTPVVGRRFRAHAFPLPIVGGDGSPVRLVAEVGSDAA